MFIWFEGAGDSSQIQEISRLGLTGAALLAVVILWRDNLALRASNTALMREMLQAAQAMKEIPNSTDRLRQEVLSALTHLRDVYQSVRPAYIAPQDSKE